MKDAIIKAIDLWGTGDGGRENKFVPHSFAMRITLKRLDKLDASGGTDDQYRGVISLSHAVYLCSTCGAGCYCTCNI